MIDIEMYSVKNERWNLRQQYVHNLKSWSLINLISIALHLSAYMPQVAS